MYGRLIKYLEQNNLLTDKQYGFREKHSSDSTYMELLDLIDHITEELDSKKLILSLKWSPNFKWESIVTPRSLIESTFSNCC